MRGAYPLPSDIQHRKIAHLLGLLATVPLRTYRVMKHLLLALLLAIQSTAEPGLPPELFTKLETPWPKNHTINLVFHGHSVPAGYHKTPEVKPFESYPHLVHRQLKERYPHAVINIIITAIGGEGSIAGAKRFETDVLIHKPDVIFIDYALNDRRSQADDVEAAWKSMHEMAVKAAIPVIFITPTGDSRAKLSDPADPLNQRAELIRKLAAQETIPLADVFAEWKAEIARGTKEDDLLSQINHPNLRGHTLAAGVISKWFIRH